MGQNGRRRGAAYLAALAVLGAGAWSVTAGPAAPDGVLSVPGGTVHVGRVHAATAPHHAMPGMGTDDDPVPAGARRITVDVTLVAAERVPLAYEVDRFALDGATPHRAVLPGSSVPAGAQLSGSLVFDVPAGDRRGVLTFDGGDAATVALP